MAGGVCFWDGAGQLPPKPSHCVLNSAAEGDPNSTPCHACCKTLSSGEGMGHFAVALQMFLALLGFSSLLVKRRFETLRRSQSVWLLDVSKQLVSMACAHGMGMLNAHVMGQVAKAGGDECSWYFVAFSLDTTLGVTLAFFALKAVECVAPTASPSIEGASSSSVSWESQVVGV